MSLVQYNDTTDVSVVAPSSGETAIVKAIFMENKSGATETFVWEINRNATGATAVIIVSTAIVNGGLSREELTLCLEGDESDVLNTRLTSAETGISTAAASYMLYS